MNQIQEYFNIYKHHKFIEFINKNDFKLLAGAIGIVLALCLIAYITFEPSINRIAQQNNNLNAYVSQSGDWRVVDLNAMVKDCNSSSQCVLAIFRTFRGGEDITLRQIENVIKDVEV